MEHIFFRTDSSDKIGNGHVMRCLTVAEGLKKRKIKTTFISRPHKNNLNNFIIQKGFRVIELPKIKKEDNKFDDWLGVDELDDAKDTKDIVVNFSKSMIVVDHYSIGETWEKYLRPYLDKIIVIDDLANRNHDCDFLIDQNWFNDLNLRYNQLLNDNCIKLLGPSFSLLREEFEKTKKTVKPGIKKVDTIFLFFGGTDPYNLTSKFLKILNDPIFKKIKLNIAIGENNIFKDEIKNLIKLRENSQLYVQIDNISSLIKEADIGIGSAGINNWERMCLGLPSLVVSFADNHVEVLKDLIKEDFIFFLGDIDDLNEYKVKKKLVDIINNPGQLSSQSKKIFKLVNASGSSKLIDWITGSIDNYSWSVRRACKEDAKLYFQWANDDLVRSNAINKSSITWEEHIDWFHRSLVNKDVFLFLIDVENIPIGQVRFEKEDNFFRIDYSIRSQLRGRNLGKKLLRLAINKLSNKKGKHLLGEVLPSNIASSKIFQELGFNLTKHSDIHIYTKRLKGAL